MNHPKMLTIDAVVMGLQMAVESGKSVSLPPDTAKDLLDYIKHSRKQYERHTVQVEIPGKYIEIAAQAAHEVNRAYCAALGDYTADPWAYAENSHKDSMIAGVRNSLENPNPRASHAGWLRHKVIDGWKHGPVKDPEKKEHPCMVPYEKLPHAQKAKDFLFLCTVHAVLAALCGKSDFPFQFVDVAP